MEAVVKWITELSRKKPSQILDLWLSQHHKVAKNPENLLDDRDNTIDVDIFDNYTGWTIFDSICNRRYIVARLPKPQDVVHLLKNLVSKISDVKFIVSLSLPSEGKLDERGVVAFEDIHLCPLTTREHRIWSIPEIDGTISHLVLYNRFFFVAEASTIFHLSMRLARKDQPILSNDCVHIQQNNWPPDALPHCTDSVLKTAYRIENLARKLSNIDLLITCTDPGERCNCFVILCCAVSRLTTNTVDIGTMVAEISQNISAKTGVTMCQQLYVWLHYALVEHCFHQVLPHRSNGDKRKLFKWLMKLRRHVYRF